MALTKMEAFKDTEKEDENLPDVKAEASPAVTEDSTKLTQTEKKGLVEKWQKVLDSTASATENTAQWMKKMSEIIESSDSLKALKTKLKKAMAETKELSSEDVTFKESLKVFLKKLF